MYVDLLDSATHSHSILCLELCVLAFGVFVFENN